MSRRVKTAAQPAPQSHGDADIAIQRIGELQRERTLVEAAMNEELAAVKGRFEAQSKPLREEITGLAAGVQAWCEAHRSQLTRDGATKTYRFGAGEVAWRMTPPKIVIRGKEMVIERLKGLGLDRFLRVRIDPDKDAMLKERETAIAVEGVSVTQREEFAIKPFETTLEEVA